MNIKKKRSYKSKVKTIALVTTAMVFLNGIYLPPFFIENSFSMEQIYQEENFYRTRKLRKRK